MASNANSAIAKKLGLEAEQPPPVEATEEKKGWRERRKRSEWVFRPLRVKFKVKELEELYKSSVFRQKQSLLLSACLLMAFISFLFILTYLGQEKVIYLVFTAHNSALGICKNIMTCESFIILFIELASDFGAVE